MPVEFSLANARKRVRFRERGVTALKRICRTCVRHLMGGPGTVEYPPDKWRGELEGLHTKHVGDILVTVKVTWTDGSERRSQGLNKPVVPHPGLRLPRDGPVSPVLGASLRRQAALTGDRCRDKFRKW